MRGPFAFGGGSFLVWAAERLETAAGRGVWRCRPASCSEGRRVARMWPALVEYVPIGVTRHECALLARQLFYRLSTG